MEILSFQNEPMKFFFRITDLNKKGDKFDFFNGENPLELVVKPPVRRVNGDRNRSNRKRESTGKSRKNGRPSKKTSQDKAEICDSIKIDKSCGENSMDERTRIDDITNETNVSVVENGQNDSLLKNDKRKNEECFDNGNRSVNSEFSKNIGDFINSKPSNESNSGNENNHKTWSTNNDIKISNDTVDQENKENENSSPKHINNVGTCGDSSIKDCGGSNGDNLLCKQDTVHQTKSDIQPASSAIKNAIYTNITLNRTNNVEIVTKMEKVSNKDGQNLGVNVLKQTVKKSNAVKVASTSQPILKQAQIPSGSNDDKNVVLPSAKSVVVHEEAHSVVQAHIDDVEKEKRLFLRSFELKAKIPMAVENVNTIKKEKVPIKKVIIQKRKNSSPIKNEKTAKKPKLDKKPTKKIIIQCKPKTPAAATGLPTVPGLPSNCTITNSLQNTGLQTLIENCKIPSSLSITIKETSDSNKQPTLPPVKNYIEILKLPDENGMDASTSSKDTNSIATKLEFPIKLCDNDSEQKVDQDLAEIARSLTEKIPMSTTISQIVGPKQQFPIPTKPNVSTKQIILPSPVPELSSKLLNIPKDASKLSPRSPQTFQKIFEESIKKPGDVKGTEKDQKNALDLTNEGPAPSNNNKRNILEIASQLYKKTKMELEKNQTELPTTLATSVAKVPIPRLKSAKPQPQKNLKFEIADAMKYPQTVTNLHSNALGLNYTVSVESNTSSATKVNGIVTNIAKENSLEYPSRLLKGIPVGSDAKTTMSTNPFVLPKELPCSSPRPTHIPRNLSPGLGYNSPKNSPKHSPKSSPVIKHMYAPTPNLLMDPLRVNTFNHKLPSPKLNDISKQSSPSGKVPSPCHSKMSPSPKLSPSLPKPIPSSSLSPKTPIPNQPTRSSTKPAQDSPVSGGSSPSPQAKSSPSPNASNQMSPNQIMEKYNIQNLAQLTASLNFNAATLGLNPGNQLAALQHAMFLKHFEMQNRQNWLNMNQGPLLQYEKYLQSLKSNQNHLLGNIKEN